MKKAAPIPTLIFVLSLISCTTKSESIPVMPMDRAFILHSSPNFKGYFYQGSDTDFHYFISKWKYAQDKRFKVLKTDVNIKEVFELGNKEREVDLLKTQAGLADKNSLKSYIIFK